ncbi:MAG: DUF2273 domain-containing protein [Clostridia bacterium]|nr:DUF2273 domain-containing protein [Clostridia bacterium]NCC74886.1 DUF2273 domain-containing protein [Clostridia bacterium]
MKSVWQNLHAVLKDKNPALVGAGIGLSLSLSLVIFGFWKTVFILGLTVAGYYLGSRLFSNPEEFRNLLDKILPPGKYR